MGIQSEATLNALANLLIAAIPVITGILSYISYRLAEALKAQKEATIGKIGEQNWRLLENYVQLAVKTAEQFGLKGELENIGTEKKAYVLDVVQEFLDAHKIEASATDIELMLEGALRDGVHKSWDSTPLVGLAPQPVNDTQETSK